MVRLRIKSAANMNAPFNTLKNKGFVPSKSRLISLATRATSFKIRSSGMKGVKRLSLI